MSITLHSSDFPANSHIPSSYGIVARSKGYSRKASGTTKTTIAYVVSISSCGAKSLFDGAAVLHHSIHAATMNSTKYDYKMYAIVHPASQTCGRTAPLEPLGYNIIVRDVPVALDEIRGEILRSRIENNG
jgi:hypothetical protein